MIEINVTLPTFKCSSERPVWMRQIGDSCPRQRSKTDSCSGLLPSVTTHHPIGHTTSALHALAPALTGHGLERLHANTPVTTPKFAENQAMNTISLIATNVCFTSTASTFYVQMVHKLASTKPASSQVV